MFRRRPAVAYPRKVQPLPGGEPRVEALVREAQPRRYAEVGCYEGETAVRVAAACPYTRIALFDFADNVEKVGRRLEGHAGGVELHPSQRLTYDSYCWRLGELLEEGAWFDAVFLDGAHTWHHDALAFLLLDRLIPPGGLLMLDDYGWTMDESPSMNAQVWPEVKRHYTEEQRACAQVRLIVDRLIRPDPRWEEVEADFGFRKRPG